VLKNNKIKHNEKQITVDSLEVGKILKMRFYTDDGIVIDKAYESRLKYFVVIGQIINHGIVGAFLINSNINPKALIDYQFPLFVKDYPDILKYNSYLDCSDIFELDKVKIIKSGLEIGKLTEKDLQLVIETIVTSEVLSLKDKKKYGFNDKK